DTAVRGASIVYHLAAVVSVPLSVRRPDVVSDVNARGTLTVLEAAFAAGVQRVVYSSSTAVYGDAERLPVAENLPSRPLSPYGHSKLGGERHALAFHTEHGL